MNKSDHQAFRLFSQTYSPAITAVFVELYHWGTITWNGHEAGGWFYKSAEETAKDLGMSRTTVKKAYDIIKMGKCPYFQSEVRMKGNYPITYFKIVDQSNELSKNHQITERPTNNNYQASNWPTPGQSVAWYQASNCPGINIITHNKNSMSIRDTREDPKVDEQQMVEASKIQTNDISKMVEIWNSLIRPSRPETMSTQRELQCFEVLRDYFNNDLDNWREHCIRISQSSYLMGDDFTLYLSWALKPEHIEKVQNAGYDDNAQKQKKKALAESSKQLPTLPLDEALSDCISEVDRKVKEILFHKLGPVTYSAWIKDIAFEMKGDQICITSCGDYTRKRIEQDFGDQLKQAYAAVYASLSDCKTSLIDHREGVDVDLLTYGNKTLTSSGDVLWAK